MDPRNEGNPFFENVRQTIETYGHMILCVGGDNRDPSMHYTIGLERKFGFEIIVFSLPYRTGQTVLQDIARRPSVQLNTPIVDLVDRPVIFKLCDDARARQYAVQAFNYYGRTIKVVQLVLSDRNNHLPGMPGFDYNHMNPLQPLLY